MAAKWRESAVGAEAEILLGFAFKSTDFSWEPPGHRLVRGDNIKRGKLEWGEKTRYWRSPTPDLEKYVLRAGDVVVGMDGSRVGENFAVISSEDLPALLVQRVACLRARHRLDQSFLRYLICNPAFTAYIKAVHTGTSIPHISGGQIGAYPIRIPPLEDQRAIAHILGTLDDKINLNRRRSESLEMIARTLFTSWFVDFEPVRAKAEGRDPGLPESLADLFPSSFVDSELGEIPAGWEIHALGNIAEVDKGLSYKGDDLTNEDGMPMVNLGCFVGGGGFKAENIKRYRGEYKERHIVRTGDLIIANTDMTQNRVILGSPALVPELGPERRFLYTHHTFALRFKKDREQWRRYVYFTLLLPKFREVAEGFATGTTVLALPRDGVLKYSTTFPPAPLLAVFERHVECLIAASDVSRQQSSTLAALRDALLPKLISGDLRVTQAAQFLAEGRA